MATNLNTIKKGKILFLDFKKEPLSILSIVDSSVVHCLDKRLPNSPGLNLQGTLGGGIFFSRSRY